MIVMKFGGTSVEDAAAMRIVTNIVARELRNEPLVVLSACSGVTNALLRAAHSALRNEVHDSLSEIQVLRTRHLRIARELGLIDTQFEVCVLFDQLDRLSNSGPTFGEGDLRFLDQFASYGERVSTLLLSQYLQRLGIPTVVLDAKSIMITDNQFTAAVPQFAIVKERMREICLPHLNAARVVVTQGFVGGTLAGETTTIGRGGSDYSAAIFGAALGADEIQIWTDVDGVLSADPTLVPDARHIKHMTFREAAELAYFGARVLHPKTIQPAIENGIPVRVLNTKRPEYEGTRIARNGADTRQCIVKSIAYKEGITLVNIESTRMLMAHGFLARVFEVFSHHKKSIDVIATSEIGVSLTIDNPSRLEQIQADLNTFADVEILPARAVLCIVGENMRRTKGVAAKIFAALDRASVNAELISHGGSEINLTVVIREDELHAAVRALHEEFFLEAEEFEAVSEYSSKAS